MLVDAHHRGAPFFWFPIILLVPFGEVLYFCAMPAPDLFERLRARRMQRPPSVEDARYRFQENPCQENEAALAACLFDAGEVSEARALYERLLGQDPDDKRALYGLALCQLRLEAADEATASLERVVALERSYADHRAWLKLGEALLVAGRPAQALETLECLVRAAPRIEHQVALAQAQIGAGQAGAALRTLETSLEEYRHAPRFIRREAKEPARRASRILSGLKPA